MKRADLKRRVQGFTLVELLVVIVIIAILAAMSMTGVSLAMRHAKKTMAEVESLAIKEAFENYYRDYRRWPNFPGVMDPEWEAVEISGDVALMLSGFDEPPGNNKKRFPYMVFKNTDLSGEPISPWGDPSRDEMPEFRYFAKFDNNFDNVISGTGDPLEPPEDTIKADVIVWTYINGNVEELIVTWE